MKNGIWSEQQRGGPSQIERQDKSEMERMMRKGHRKKRWKKREGIKRRERHAGARVPCHDLTLWRSSSETAWASLAVVRSSLVMSAPTVAHAAN